MSAPRLKTRYDEAVVPALQEEFKYDNPHQIPGLVKIVANMGLGEAVQNPKVIEGAQRELSASLDRRLSSQRRRSPSRLSSFAKVCLLAAL